MNHSIVHARASRSAASFAVTFGATFTATLGATVSARATVTTTLTALAGALVLTLASADAFAHVTLEEPAAIAGSGYKAVLRIGHGCDGSATQALAVQIPAGFQGAKPMPKAGWTVEVRRAALAQPYESHGRRVTDDVVEITWRAKTTDAYLPDAFFDEFVLRGQTPTQPGALWFKVLQSCEKGQLNWAETPARGTSTRGLKEPAVLLEVLPGMAGDAHQH
jgi:hypothetical protein